MPPLYQRPGRLLPALLGAGALVAACAPPAEAPPPSPRRPTAIELFLAARSTELVDVDEAGGALVNESTLEGVRALHVAPDLVVRRVAPALTAPHRARAALAGGRVLIEIVDPSGARWLLVEPAGGRREIEFPGPGGRFLGRSADRGRAGFAWSPVDGAERWLEFRLPGARPLLVAEAPAGFAFAALSGDSRRAVLQRRLHDEADEVLWFDRAAGELRLLLPTDLEGRFRPLGFDAGATRLRVVAEDPAGGGALEEIDLADGQRTRRLDGPCVAVGLPDPATEVVEVDCAGRRELRRLAGPLPWEGHLPAGLSGVRALAAPDGAWWIETAGPRAPSEIGRLPAGGLFEPATWGLAPRLDPERLPVPQLRTVTSGATPLPAELWLPPDGTGLRAGLVWLSDGDRLPPAGRFAPLPAALASRGIAVLVLRPRGDSTLAGPARRAADGDPAGAARADLAAAMAALRDAVDAPRSPTFLLGNGAWSGAVVALALADPAFEVAGGVALDPAVDPLALLDRIEALPEPGRSRALSHWGDPASARNRELRKRLLAATYQPRRPLLVVHDAGEPGAAARQAAFEQAAAGGVPVVALRRARSVGARLDRSTALAVWRHLRDTLAPAR
jgi:hypothetical protein